MSGGANLLAITLEVISRRDTICEGEKMARERKRTIHETKGRTTARWLGLSSISWARVENTGIREEEGKWARYCLPLARPGEGAFIRKSKVLGTSMLCAK